MTLNSGEEIKVTEVDAELPTLVGNPSGSNTGCWAKFVKDNNEGWCHLRDLIPVAGQTVKWLKVAHKEIGTGAVGDKQFAYINSVTGAAKKTDEEKRQLDWCACFMKWCVDMAGYKDAKDSTMAQAWKKWAEERVGGGSLEGAKLGDIAVGRRGPIADGLGHVAIFIMADAKQEWMLLLGGNQDENPLTEGGTKRVRYAWYPRVWGVKGVGSAKDAQGHLLTVRYKAHP